MNDHINSWRDSSKVFEKQLALNESYLATDIYPPHWKQFLHLIKFANLTIKPLTRLLDIGCGCGACSELCHRRFPEIVYHGIDYSPHAIELAKNRWKRSFEIKDFWSLKKEDLDSFDIIHTDALFDVMPNGDEAVEFLLALKPPIALLNRVDLSSGPATAKVYQAYDQIPTYAYRHDYSRLFMAFSGYNITTEGNAFLLWL